MIIEKEVNLLYAGSLRLFLLCNLGKYFYLL